MLYKWKSDGQLEIVRTEATFQKSNLISTLYLHTIFSPENSYISARFGRLNDYGQFEPEGDPVMMIGTPLGNLFEWVCTVPTSMLEIDGTISFSFTASVLSGQVEGENTYTSVTSGVISRYVNPSAGVPAPPLDLLTQMKEDIDGLYIYIDNHTIEGVQVNGTDLEIVDKKVNITPAILGAATTQEVAEISEAVLSLITDVESLEYAIANPQLIISKI